MAACLFGRVKREILHQERPRTDEAHVAAQHVEQARQLIQAGRPQHAPERRQSHIIRQRVSSPIDRIEHRPELDHLEGLTMQSRAHLPEEHWTPELAPDENRDDDQHWAERDDRRQRRHEIKYTLQGMLPKLVAAQAARLPR